MEALNTKKMTAYAAFWYVATLDLQKKMLFNQKRLEKAVIQNKSLKIPPLPQKRLCVFLGSMRSGTTLLSNCLSLNPQIFCPEELHLLYAKSARKIYELYSSDSYLSALFLGYLHALEKSTNISREKAIELWYNMVNNDIPVELLYSYLLNQSGSKVVVDKTTRAPLLLNSLKILNSLRQYQPIIIYQHRHPLAVINSNINVTKGAIRTNFVKLALSPVHYPNHYKQFKKAINDSDFRFFEHFWYLNNKTMLEFYNQVPEELRYRLSFEAFLKNPDSKLKDICKVLDVEYSGKMTEIGQIRRDYGHWEIFKMISHLNLPIGDINYLFQSGKLKTLNIKRAKTYRKQLMFKWTDLLPKTQELAVELGYSPE